METAKLVEVTRGDYIESTHRGVIAVYDSLGQKIASLGDPQQVTFMRSAAKPVQALPVVETGAAAHFGFSTEELALMMASHSGEEQHVRVGRQIMAKLGLNSTYLQCGTHPPLHKASARALAAKGEAPTVYHCTCSGKHAGMLALARYFDYPLEGYYHIDHPVQQMMLQTIAMFAGLSAEQVGIGVDGCGVPVFALPVEKMATIYARWAKPFSLEGKTSQACLTLQEAMTSHPGIIAGTGRLASDIMRVTGKKLLVKDGNEGVICMGVPAKGWGIAIKIADGNIRALGPVAIEALKQLELLTQEEYNALLSHSKSAVKNYRGELIGEIRPAFTF